MLNSKKLNIWFALFLLTWAGCAGSGSGKNGMAGGDYNTTLGIAYLTDFYAVIERILLNKYQFVTARTEQSAREEYYETQWKDRALFADEVNLQIRTAQIRFIFKGRSRSGNQLKVHLYVENQIQREGYYQWEPGPVTDSLKKYLNGIAGELRSEFRMLY